MFLFIALLIFFLCTAFVCFNNFEPLGMWGWIMAALMLAAYYCKGAV